MEADWEVEIGPGTPVIDACWPGFVDLRRTPELARQLPEVASLPSLAKALLQLNAVASPVWTAKCDAWPVLDPGDPGDQGEFDASEMDATPGGATHAWACYIDLLPRSDQQWIVLTMAVDWCKAVCRRLHALPLRCSRVDLIVRRSMITPLDDAIGITAYLTACGPSADEANRVLDELLGRFVDAICRPSTVE